MGRFDNDLFFGVVLILMFAALGSFLITLTRVHYQTRHEQIKLFLCALGVRFVASIVIYEFGLVRVLGDEDSSGWWSGIALMSEWNQRHISLLDLPGILAGAYEGHHRGYGYLVGALFYLTDSPARLPAAALNCFFGAMTVVFVYRIALSLFSRWAAVRAGWLACFFPSMIIWSSQTLKEPVVIFLESVALYACVHLKLSGFSLRYVLLCAAAIVLLPPFRFYAAYVAGAAALLALLVPQLSKRKSSIQSALAVAALVVPLIISSGVLARNEAKFEQFSQLKEVERFRMNVASGYGSGVRSQYDLNTSSGLFLGTAIGAAHLLLAPFPWQLGGGSLRMALTAPELLIWWWLVFVGLIPGIWHACRTRFGEIQPMLFFTLGLGLLYSMMFGNVGLIFRQRAQLLPWLLIFAMVGLEQRAIRKLLKRRLEFDSPAPQRMAQVSQSGD
jgi:4-amino-4-deoxy-L-arabinose transferase-like glycosyltransferase